MLDAKTALDTVAVDYKSAKATLESPNSDCTALFNRATEARQMLREKLPTAGLKAIADRLEKLVKDAKDQRDAIDHYRSAHPKCPLEMTAPFADRAELLARPVEMRENLDKLEKANKTLTDALAKIDQVLGAGSNAFTQFVSLGEYDEATSVTIDLDRKDELVADSKFEDVTKVKISFGGPAWFTLAGGAAGSSIDRTHTHPFKATRDRRQTENRIALR